MLSLSKLSPERYRIYTVHLNALVGKCKRQLKLGTGVEF